MVALHPIKALDSTPLETVTHQVWNLGVTILGNYREHLTFFDNSSPSCPVVFGLLWLRLHNPHVDWVASTVVGWSPFCHSRCLRSAAPFSHGKPPSISSPDLSAVPREYHDLGQVFSKEKARTDPMIVTLI